MFHVPFSLLLSYYHFASVPFHLCLATLVSRFGKSVPPCSFTLFRSDPSSLYLWVVVELPALPTFPSGLSVVNGLLSYSSIVLYVYPIDLISSRTFGCEIRLLSALYNPSLTSASDQVLPFPQKRRNFSRNMFVDLLVQAGDSDDTSGTESDEEVCPPDYSSDLQGWCVPDTSYFLIICLCRLCGRQHCSSPYIGKHFS